MKVKEFNQKVLSIPLNIIVFLEAFWDIATDHKVRSYHKVCEIFHQNTSPTALSFINIIILKHYFIIHFLLYQINDI